MKFFTIVFAAVVMLIGTGAVATAQTAPVSSDSLAVPTGKWTGSFEGSDSGNFELVLSQDTNRKLTGQIIMLPPDGSRYPIDLKVVTWQSGRLSAAYTDPQSGGDVSFTGKPEQAAMKGTWEANAGQATGTWQLTRLAR